MKTSIIWVVPKVCGEPASLTGLPDQSAVAVVASALADRKGRPSLRSEGKCVLEAATIVLSPGERCP